MISDNQKPVFAVGVDDYKFIMRDGDTEEVRLPEDAGCVVEIWKYSPCILSGKTEIVDSLSLFLSMRDEPDERGQGALEDLMEEFKW